MKFFDSVKNAFKKKWVKIVSIVVGVAILAGATTGIVLGVKSCKKDDAKYDNEKDALRFSTLEVDKVFNPFFSTSATDSQVVGMTQLSLLTNDENGKVAYGDNEEVIAKDFKIVHNNDNTTTYYFVLKNNIKFSNGSYLTMKDVLFNYYVYLDPSYSGSSTMYSTDIVGLKEYRTQSSDENEQDRFLETYQKKANDRLDAFESAYNDIKNNVLPKESNKKFDSETQLKSLLGDYTKSHTNEIYANLLADYEKAVSYFDDELQSDWNSSVGGYVDQKFYYTYKDANGKTRKAESSVKITTDVEMFLLNEGIITWRGEATDDKGTGSRLVYPGNEETIKGFSKEQAIELVRSKYLPNDVVSVMRYWAATSANLINYLTNDEMSKALGGDSMTYKNISGIKFENKDGAVTIKNDDGSTYATYEKPVYHDETKKDYVVSGNEVLSITINGVDPKAVWNFGIGVAPMYYYSNEEQIAKFDYEEHFGVDYANVKFFDEVLKSPSKNGLPVGAGAYAASSSDGGLCVTATATSVDLAKAQDDAGKFYFNGNIYYERNPYYDLALSNPTKTGPDGKEYHVAKINKVRYVVRSASNMINSLKAGEIDFAEPNAKPELKTQLGNDGIGNTDIETSGYGYIGINAGKVPSIYVRRAIMHTVDTSMCVSYYETMAKAIKRPMSTTNWAYPEDTIDYYPYIGGEIPKNLLEKDSKGGYKFKVYEFYRLYVSSIYTEKQIQDGVTLTQEQQDTYLKELVKLGGYTEGGDGVFSRSSSGKTDRLKYKFTIAGDTTDHPAYNALDNAASILNRVGFEITVKTDANALKLLSSGDLTVWAAAWSSTIDPDMYQVYHKDSKATSVLNWGYREILNDTANKYSEEKRIIGELSEKIDLGRSTEVEDERKPYYADALDLVMELAVELPTYQRKDLYAYNQNRIDTSTFFKNPTSFKGLTSDLTTVSLLVQ